MDGGRGGQDAGWGGDRWGPGGGDADPRSPGHAAPGPSDPVAAHAFFLSVGPTHHGPSPMLGCSRISRYALFRVSIGFIFYSPRRVATCQC